MQVKVTVRIGRSGEKLHPATAELVTENPGTPWARRKYKNLQLACSCPNSQNGHASNAARIVGDGWEAVNCARASQKNFR